MIYDVPASDLIKKVAEELKKIEAIKPPVWSVFVKTGVHKERPPVELDWWYHRAAAVLRSVAILGPIGVEKLRVKYGGKKRRGHQPAEFRKGSGNILRKILQQLGKANLVKFIEVNNKKGRIITSEGQSLLDKTAVQLAKGKEKLILKSEDLTVVAEKPVKPKSVKKEAPKAESTEAPAEMNAEKKKHVVKPRPVKKETPKEEAPKEVPKEEAPKEEAPKQE